MEDLEFFKFLTSSKISSVVIGDKKKLFDLCEIKLTGFNELSGNFSLISK